MALMDSNGFKWIQMDSNGFKWIQMDSNGFNYSNGFKWSQMQPQYGLVREVIKMGIVSFRVEQ
jgi:hypothetical protein